MNTVGLKEVSKMYEPWPGYFELRSKEIEVFLKFWKPGNVENLLEIGCGPGLIATILAGFSKKVFITDLVKADKKTNTRGMDKTIELLRRQNKLNISFFGSTAISLPVRSGCMDVAFSMSLLEHIALNERDTVVQEMKRVLKDGGCVVAIIPTVTERIGAFLHYYTDLVLRTVKLIFTGIFKKAEKSKPPYLDKPGQKKHFSLTKLFPPIHGHYRNHFEELYNQLPFKWEALFKRNGFEIVKTCTIRFLPFSTKPFISFYSRTNWVDSFLGDKIPFKYFGKNYCIIAKIKQ